MVFWWIAYHEFEVELIGIAVTDVIFLLLFLGRGGREVGERSGHGLVWIVVFGR